MPGIPVLKAREVAAILGRARVLRGANAPTFGLNVDPARF